MTSEEDRTTVSTYDQYISQPNERTMLLVRELGGSTWQERFGLYEPKNLNFWRCIVVEFILTLLFTFCACGSALPLHIETSNSEAVCVGLSVAILTGVSIEGFGFFNPAISLGLLISNKIKLVRFIFYVAVQSAGSVAGAGLLYLYTPKSIRGNLATLSLHNEVSTGVAFMIELTLTFIVMWVVWTAVQTRNIRRNFSVPAPIIVGLSFAVCKIVGTPYTGGAMNPIRAFGPGVVTRNLNNHWVYWFGPFTGAALAAVCAEYVFKLSPVERPQTKQQHDGILTVQPHINTNSTV